MNVEIEINSRTAAVMSRSIDAVNSAQQEFDRMFEQALSYVDARGRFVQLKQREDGQFVLVVAVAGNGNAPANGEQG